MSATPYPAQPQAAVIQQPQTIIVQNPEEEYVSFMPRKAVSTGGTQLVLGILTIIFQICATAIEAEHGSVAAGIWAGFFFLVAGCIGLTARTRKSCCKITFYGLFSLIAFLCAVALLILAAIGVDNDQEKKEKVCRWEDEADDWFNKMKARGHNSDEWEDDWDWDDWDECSKYNSRVAMNAMLVIFAVIEIFVALYAIVICLQGCCGGKSRKQVPAVAHTGQAVVIYPTTNAPRQYIAYPQAPAAQPVAPPAYDATAPPAYVFYEPASPPQGASAPANLQESYNNPTYRVDPPENIYATADNNINENRQKGPHY